MRLTLRRRRGLACIELVELVTDYLEGSLSRSDRARFEAHLGDCHGCTAYLEQFRETIRLTGTLREDDLVPAARDALLEQFRDWKRGEL
jgi:anti-sigma factor RsiW